MSAIQGRVGKWALNWKSAPHGSQGVAQVEVDGRALDVRWRRDADGVWIELPHGVFGFDLQGEAGDDGRTVYQVSERGSHEYWSGQSFLRAGEAQSAGAAAGAKKGVRVRAQMPGKILRIQVKQGDQVEKGQAMIVMEAMKMENEIRAAQAGTVGPIQVAEGQAVETGADLCVIEPLVRV